MTTTEITPSQLVAALLSGERPSRVVDFPRTDIQGKTIGQLRIRVLTQEEQMMASVAGEKYTREFLKDGKKEDLGYEAVFNNAACLEVLVRACRDVDDPTRPAFPSAKILRQTVTADECGVLFQHYLTTQLELGPIAARMTEAEMDAWVTRVGEGGDAFPLDLLSLELLKTLLLFSARQVVSLRTGRSSSGPSPASDISSDSPPVLEPEGIEHPEVDATPLEE